MLLITSHDCFFDKEIPKPWRETVNVSKEVVVELFNHKFIRAYYDYKKKGWYAHVRGGFRTGPLVVVRWYDD